MLSYSGRLHIEDHHFVELLQELTKIANYKLLLFPNLTNAFLQEHMGTAADPEGEEFDYDNFLQDQRIAAPLRGAEAGEEWS